MKLNLTSVCSDASKLLTAVALSALLVACGGGTSGDATDAGETTGTTDDPFGTGDEGDTTVDGGTDDGFIDPLIGDEDGDGIPDEDELDVCKGLGGTDPGSTNDAWNDNCYLDYDIDLDAEGVTQSPFFNSTYVQGVQRVLYCTEAFEGVYDSIGPASDGKFGQRTRDAVREFQRLEGLLVDGRVGQQTWGRMQTLVEDPALLLIDGTDEAYSAYGIARTAEPTNDAVDCTQQINFFGKYSTDGTTEDEFEAWELAKTAGVDDKGSFSIASPQ